MSVTGRNIIEEYMEVDNKVNTIVIYPDINHEILYGTKAFWINDFHEE